MSQRTTSFINKWVNHMGRRLPDAHEVCRDSTCFKNIDRPRKSRGDGNQNRLKPDNWREITLRKTRVGKPNN